jgi:hypothetical protein
MVFYPVLRPSREAQGRAPQGRTWCISRSAKRQKLKPNHASTLVGWMLVLARLSLCLSDSMLIEYILCGCYLLRREENQISPEDSAPLQQSTWKKAFCL